MGTWALRLRWSWRDLRHRWPQVVAIAVILAIGTGIFAALTSTASWRRASNDASFEAARLHDLEVRLAAGTVTDEGSLLALIAQIPDAADVAVAEERLVWPTQLEVDAAGVPVLVPADVVGADPGALVDQTMLRDGSAPLDADTGLLELKFARARHLPPSGTVTVAGNRPLAYSGRALSPEYFWLASETGAVIGQGNQATVFVTLPRAQQLVDRAGQVNDLVVSLRPGADAATVRSQLDSALTAHELGGTVTTRDDEPAYRLLYDDIGTDQQIWNVISALVLGGASFAAFNLVSRIVDAQRREFGIGMALGVPRRQLAVRPLLVGAQIALAGVVAGVGVGLLFAEAMRTLLDSVVPLPVWNTPFQPGRFLAASAIGFALPFTATVIPVWRATRTQPVDAIRIGHAASGRRGWSRLGSQMRWPRRTLHQYPLRNLLRAPRRTALTALAIGAALTVLIGVFGMLDSFGRTVDRADAELVRQAPDRTDVQLDAFEPITGPTLSAIGDSPVVGTVAPQLVVPAQVGTQDDRPLDVLVTILDMATAPWTPTVVDGEPPSLSTGVLLSAKAMHDLDLSPGDRIVLHHPRRSGAGYEMVDTDVRVAGSHALPLRPIAYLDATQAELFNLTGIANAAQVLPAAGTSPDALQRALFGVNGVAAATSVGDAGAAWDDALAQYTGVLRLVQAATLVLALLIAYNSASISVDERAREHATMFAFGVRPGAVLSMNVVESAVVGVLGAIAGFAGGYVVMSWIFGSLLPRTIPDVAIDRYLAPGNALTLLVIGVAVVALAPLPNARRLQRTDLTATLRVVE